MKEETFYHLCDKCKKYYPVSLDNILYLHDEFDGDMVYDLCPLCEQKRLKDELDIDEDYAPMGEGELLILRS